MIDRPVILRSLPRGLAWFGVIALGCALGLAQDAAQSNAPRSDGQIEMDVVHALDGLTQADRTLRAHLDTAGQALQGDKYGPAVAQAATDIQSVSDALAEPADFKVLSVVTSTLLGLSRGRVEALLKR